MTTQGSSNSFSSRPSTSQGFTPKSSGFTDLSSLAPEDPFAPLGESMAGGGTVASAQNGANGTPSEQSQGNPDRTPTLDEGATHDYTNHV